MRRRSPVTKPVVYSLISFVVVVVFLRVGAAFSTLLALAAVVGLVWRWRVQPERVQLERAVAARAFHGDRLVVRITASNEGRSIHWLELADLVPQTLRTDDHSARHVVAMDRGQAVSVDYPIRCSRRGRYAIGPLEARSGDLFGLTETEFEDVPPSTLIVYPRVVPLASLGIPARSPVASIRHRSSLVDDSARLRGLRPYQRGDSRRVIHWPASAKTGDLQVKLHDPAIARGTMVCVNLLLPYYPRGRKSSGVEFGVTAAASIAHHIVTQEKLEVGVAVAGAIPSGVASIHPVGSGRSHLMAILETLAQVESQLEGRFLDTVSAATTDLPWGTTVSVLTPWVTDELSAALLSLRTRGLLPSVFLLQPTADAEAQCAPLTAAGVSVVTLTDDADLVATT